MIAGSDYSTHRAAKRSAASPRSSGAKMCAGGSWRCCGAFALVGGNAREELAGGTHEEAVREVCGDHPEVMATAGPIEGFACRTSVEYDDIEVGI